MSDLSQIHTIDDYFREFSHFHVKKATDLLRPLHTPRRDSLPDFSNATRQPFEGQAHVIAAAIKMLDETRGMIIAEPGAGKTLMGSGDTRPNLRWPGNIYLVVSVKTERDIIFRGELDALRLRHPNLQVTVTLTRDERPGSGA